MTYSGLIIDGPMDGQCFAHRHNTFEVPVRDPLPPMSAEGGAKAIPPTLGVHRVFYRHHDVKGVGLWLLEDETPEQAVQHMLNRVGIDALASRYEQITARRKDDARHAR